MMPGQASAGAEDATGGVNPVDALLDDVRGRLLVTSRPQVLIARGLGITPKHLSMIRQGHADPSLGLLRRMYSLLTDPAAPVAAAAPSLATTTTKEN